MEAAVAHALRRIGIRRVEALLVAALLTRGPLCTRDLVTQTGLRQPEVSTGIRMLRERGWVDSEGLAQEGKGRPMHEHRLKEPDAVRAHYVGLAKARIEQLREALQHVEKVKASQRAHPR